MVVLRKMRNVKKFNKTYYYYTLSKSQSGCRKARRIGQDDCKVEFGAQRWEFYVLGFGGDSLPIANQFKNT